MFRFIVFFLLEVCTNGVVYSRQIDNVAKIEVLPNYNKTLDSLTHLLNYNGKFSTAVFLVENTYYGNNLSAENFDNLVDYLARLSLQAATLQEVEKYRDEDSVNYKLNLAIFNSLFDTLNIINLKKDTTIKRTIAYSYSHTDPFGKNEWSNMFVTHLLSTRKGNCHSLAYLYKIISDKLGTSCWLSLAPNHLYIRNYSRKYGWYNTELTSATFPTDAWIMTTGYVSPDAIRSGIYMDTLSNQQSIALCVLDLAKGYEFQTHNYYDGFIVKCCNLVLQYHPVNPMALLLKAETLKKVYFKQEEEKNPDSATTYAEMERTYIALAKLHYREMPEKMYREWLNSLTKQSDKYSNKRVKQPIQSKKAK